MTRLSSGRGLPRRLTPSALTLRRKIESVRRKAVLAGLGTAVLSALGFDLGYNLLNVASVYLFRTIIYMPLLLPVGVAVFAILGLRSVRLTPFCASLDAAFRLRDRLSASLVFPREPAIPPQFVEAQARETLASVDFEGIRHSFRFRPYLPVALVLLLGLFNAFFYWRHPESSVPPSITVREGARLAAAVRERLTPAGHRTDLPQVAGTGMGGRTPPSAESEPPGPGTPRVTPPSTSPVREEEPARPASTGETAPPERKQGETGPRSDGARSGAGQTGSRSPDARPGGEGTGLRKVPSREITDRTSPLGQRPREGRADSAAVLAAATFAPPIPFFRFLSSSRQEGEGLDPDTIHFVPELFDARYRDHILAYFNALQALKEARHGS